MTPTAISDASRITAAPNNATDAVALLCRSSPAAGGAGVLVDPGVSATAEAGVVTGAAGDPADDVPPGGGDWVAGAGDGDGCGAAGVTVEMPGG